MTLYETIKALQALMDGFDPVTGEALPDGHVCEQPDVMRALYVAITTLKDAARQNETSAAPYESSGRLNAGRPWSKEDDKHLRTLCGKDVPLAHICMQLSRRPRGVLKRLTLLGLTDEAYVYREAYARAMYQKQTGMSDPPEG